MTLEPKPAATIVLVRQTEGAPQVLLVQRPLSSVFGPGAWVFPGGAVEPEDAAIAEHSPGIAAALAARMSLDPLTAAAYLGAAIREAREETGISVGRDGAAGAAPDLTGVVYLSRWITPPGQARRYDTRFFVAEVGNRLEIRLSRPELADSIWITPKQARERQRAGEMAMMPPTIVTLESLEGYTSVTAMLEAVRESTPPSYLPASADDVIR